METILSATIGQIIGGGLGIIALLSIFIEFTPIKINPISALLKWIGKRTNSDLTERFDELEDKVEKLSDKYAKIEEEFEARDAVTSRIRILRFSDEVRRNIDHSQESFEQTLFDIDNYEKYCLEHPDFKNNKTVIATQRIKDAYKNCLAKNNFL